MSKENTKTTANPRPKLMRLVSRIKSWLSAKKYRIKWKAIDKYERWWKLRGFIWWTERMYGKPKYSIAHSMNWRRNEDGVLISLFRSTNVLKIYYDGGKQTVNFFVDRKEQRIKAKRHLKRTT